MKTQEALNRFQKNNQERGISLNTVRQYNSYLRHFEREYPELPTLRKHIEDFLRKRGETPGHRGSVFTRLQGFYSYLEREEGIKSPVPPKGPIGRPSKNQRKLQKKQDQVALINDENISPTDEKVVKGGTASLSSTISISTQTAIGWFLASREASSKPLSKYTFQKYGTVFRRFVAQFPILPLTPEPLEAFFASINGVPDTRWTFKQVIRAFYRFLAKRKKLPNPMEDIVVGQPSKKLRSKLTLDQIKQLFQLSLSFADRALLTLIFDTGLRTGEICNLEPKDIYPGYVRLRGKTGEVEVPIRQETYEVLSQLTIMSPGETVFQTAQGKKLRIENVYWKVRGWLAQIGITEGKRGCHMLRHSFAPSYLLQGGTLQDLSQILGHTNIATTGIYAKMVQDQLKQQHDKASPLKALLDKTDTWECQCNDCGQGMLIPVGKMPDTPCPKCGQKGDWFAKNLYKQEALL